jgi:hypothetical protein
VSGGVSFMLRASLESTPVKSDRLVLLVEELDKHQNRTLAFPNPKYLLLYI